MTLEYSNLPCLDQDVLRYVLISIFDVGSYYKMHLKSLMLMLHPVPTSGGPHKSSQESPGLPSTSRCSLPTSPDVTRFLALPTDQPSFCSSNILAVRWEKSPQWPKGSKKKETPRKIGQPISLPFFKTHKVVDTPGFERNKPYADCGPWTKLASARHLRCLWNLHKVNTHLDVFCFERSRVHGRVIEPTKIYKPFQIQYQDMCHINWLDEFLILKVYQ